MAKNLSGMRFGRLTVIDRYGKNKNGKVLWRCLCDCGNTSYVITSYLTNGHTKSCGCLHKDKFTNSRKCDLSGKRFSKLVVKREYGEKNGSVLWECDCDCGAKTYVTTRDLNSGHIRSCGCYKIERLIDRSAYDLTGKEFGNLIVDKQYISSGNGRVWKCICSCGNQIYVKTCDLVNGHTKSCGCIKSKAETEISDYLKSHGIVFQRQKTFIGCKNQSLLRFDFYLPDYGIAIEYDGEFHYIQSSIGNDLNSQVMRDEIKTQYCKENDILLIRIPYWEKKQIDSILGEWLLYDTEETGSSDVSPLC